MPSHLTCRVSHTWSRVGNRQKVSSFRKVRDGLSKRPWIISPFAPGAMEPPCTTMLASSFCRGSGKVDERHKVLLQKRVASWLQGFKAWGTCPAHHPPARGAKRQQSGRGNPDDSLEHEAHQCPNSVWMQLTSSCISRPAAEQGQRDPQFPIQLQSALLGTGRAIPQGHTSAVPWWVWGLSSLFPTACHCSDRKAL